MSAERGHGGAGLTRPGPTRPAAMLPSQAGAGNGAAAALARGAGLGRSPVPRGANGGGGAAAGPPGARLEREALYSGSEGDSESAEEEELGGERRGLKRGLAEAAAAAAAAAVAVPAAGGAAAATAAFGSGGAGGGAVSGAKPGKKTRGRVKIKMEFIDNKLRRYTTFSKRKTGIMKKVRPRGTGSGPEARGGGRMRESAGPGGGSERGAGRRGRPPAAASPAEGSSRGRDTPCRPAGLRAVDADGHPGAAAGGQRDGPCVHLRHPQAAAHDHQRDGQGAHPDVPQLPRLAAALRPHHRPAHERHGLRGDRPHLPGVRVGQQRGDQGEAPLGAGLPPAPLGPRPPLGAVISPRASPCARTH